MRCTGSSLRKQSSILRRSNGLKRLHEPMSESANVGDELNLFCDMRPEVHLADARSFFGGQIETSDLFVELVDVRLGREEIDEVLVRCRRREPRGLKSLRDDVDGEKGAEATTSEDAVVEKLEEIGPLGFAKEGDLLEVVLEAKGACKPSASALHHRRAHRCRSATNCSLLPCARVSSVLCRERRRTPPSS